MTVAGLLLLHGIHKIQHGIDGIEFLVSAKDLPTWLAYGVYAGEVLAPALLIVGFQTRLAALVVAGTMGMAIWLAHWNDLGTLSASSGAWMIELPAFYLLAAVSIMLLGAGRYSVDGRKSRPV